MANMRLTIAFLALCCASTSSYSAEISGTWKIDTHGGPAPLCKLVQTGNNLSGSCVGPQATGAVTGTVVGSTVRWRWQWVTHAGDKLGAFDFEGNLSAETTITGRLERQETGLSLNFYAEKSPGAGGTYGITPSVLNSGDSTVQPFNGDFANPNASATSGWGGTSSIPPTPGYNSMAGPLQSGPVSQPAIRR